MDEHDKEKLMLKSNKRHQNFYFDERVSISDRKPHVMYRGKQSFIDGI
jgi:hypothetical protein